VLTDSYTTYANSATKTTTTYTHLSSADVNASLVDTASYVYDALDSIKSRANVMTVSEVQADSETLLAYLNLSRPEIEWTDGSASYPVKYELDDGVATSLTPVLKNGVNTYYLTFDFSIKNATDATPNTTRYDCQLFLDLNSDGRYSEEEQITDIVIRTADGTLVTESGGTYAMQAGVRYIVSRQMPSDFAGILPWKLEAVKLGAPHIHCSEHNYTRIAPTESEQIHILQINSNSGDFNLQYQLTSTAGGSTSNPYYSSVTNRTYYGIYGKLLRM
jgi:hypothetical protein